MLFTKLLYNFLKKKKNSNGNYLPTFNFLHNFFSIEYILSNFNLSFNLNLILILALFLILNLISILILIFNSVFFQNSDIF